ncbi:MAG: hypothetical protein KC416_06810, partial [Myxococcales bacterium]|nr:hypothetical protein [Myxococcales bacterium]
MDTTSLSLDTRGLGHVEYLIAIATVSILGLGGLSSIGHSAGEAIAGEAGGRSTGHGVGGESRPGNTERAALIANTSLAAMGGSLDNLLGRASREAGRATGRLQARAQHLGGRFAQRVRAIRQSYNRWRWSPLEPHLRRMHELAGEPIRVNHGAPTDADLAAKAAHAARRKEALALATRRNVL